MSDELDIEAIKARHLDPTRNRGRTYYVGHIEVDLAALVAEVERLRAQRRLDNEEAARLYDFARDKGRALERDDVVAYLLAGTADCAECMDEAVVRLAREIERGDHRREEGK